MRISTRILTSHDVNRAAQLFIQTHAFSSDEEARGAFLREVNRGHVFRGAMCNDTLVGLLSWEERGLHKHGVAEITRLTIPEKSFDRKIAEVLFDTVFASMDYHFTSKGSRLRKIFTAIAAHRKKARTFLEDRGFDHEAKLKDHYHDGRDEHVYSLFAPRSG